MLNNNSFQTLVTYNNNKYFLFTGPQFFVNQLIEARLGKVNLSTVDPDGLSSLLQSELR